MLNTFIEVGSYKVEILVIDFLGVFFYLASDYKSIFLKAE